MQRWEYLTVKLEICGFNNNTLAPYSVNGRVLNDWKKISLDQFVGQLGTDGWEMTGTISIYGSTHQFLFFKRPRP